MNVSRSGYYKWLSRKCIKNRWQKNRESLAELIKEVHSHHSTYGYRHIAQSIRNYTGELFSNLLCHKICKQLGIKSKARKTWVKAGEECVKYKNILNGDFNASRPFEKIVTDGTMIHCNGKAYDWIFFIDVFNNEIVGSDIKPSKHGTGILNHYDAYKDFLKNKIKRGYKDLVTIVHSDQGAIYSSQAFNKLHEHYTIERSMSRAGTPTDNPIIESLNGWIKEELYKDFKLYKSNNIYKAIDDYIAYFNNERLACTLGYKNPVQYRTERGF